ncbi:hypothetical protein DFP72DRAFT_918408 [Ephemerocybe angulata]|uniref:Uncharacterized protein n=1 Tax=Ephemerocybe angulata TaxID=980116 RepID=A0A8H6LXN6_9AGAR|nr:hypothetical protein DFP72DRAFT_918408 [Tulosesus angulatus]
MVLSLLISAFISLLVASSASAGNICAYNSRGCGGSYVCCNDIQAGYCCYWNNNQMGWSLQYTNMGSSHWWGGCYSENNCRTEATSVEATASSKCVSVPAGNECNSQWYSSKWAVAASRVEQVVDADCKLPDTIGFTWSNKIYNINVPQGQYTNLTNLLDAGDFHTLSIVADSQI